MKIGTTDITKAYIGTNEVSKICLGTTQIYPAGGGYYNVGTPSFVMRFDGSFDYYSDGNITAQKVATPTLTTGGAFGAGALAATYDSNNTSTINAVKVNISRSNWTNSDGAFFIEFWAKLENTNEAQDQFFIGNMERNANSGGYYGFFMAWDNSRQGIWLKRASNSSSATTYYCANDKAAWNALATTSSYIHCGLFLDNASVKRIIQLVNGKAMVITSASEQTGFLGYAVDNFYIGNNKISNAGTLSQMCDVRVLTGQNAKDYYSTIVSGTADSDGLYSYTIPTGSFADGGLTKYTAS